MKIEARVAVFYIGGEIGMTKDDKGVLKAIPNAMECNIRRYPDLHDEEFARCRIEKNGCDAAKELVLPTDDSFNKRVVYQIHERCPLLESANMDMCDWSRIAGDVKDQYNSCEGFVILQGTDTLCYTACALSFMFENLGKPVILTGAEIPIFDTRSDGRDNFLNALLLAGNCDIPEVCIMYCRRLYRGNRTVKSSCDSMQAFTSPNCPPLAVMGTTLQINKCLIRPLTRECFHVHKPLCTDVAMIRIYPSMCESMLRGLLKPPIKGIVIQTFGAGNVPSNRPDLIGCLAEAACRGVLILNITQCSEGGVNGTYESCGAILFECGVVSGGDMTPEAALCKLGYVLSKPDWDIKKRKEMLQADLRGELTDKGIDQTECHKPDLVRTVAKILDRTSEKDIKQLETILFTSLVNAAVSCGNFAQLDDLQERGADFNQPDVHENRTALHIAAATGQEQVVKYLIDKCVCVHAKDRMGRTPLQDAIDNENDTIIHHLTKAGAQIKNDTATGALIVAAAECGNLERVKCFKRAGIDVAKIQDPSGRTAAHAAALNGHDCVLKFLVKHGAETKEIKDKLGLTADEYEKFGKGDTCGC